VAQRFPMLELRIDISFYTFPVKVRLSRIDSEATRLPDVHQRGPQKAASLHRCITAPGTYLYRYLYQYSAPSWQVAVILALHPGPLLLQVTKTLSRAIVNRGQGANGRPHRPCGRCSSIWILLWGISPWVRSTHGTYRYSCINPPTYSLAALLCF